MKSTDRGRTGGDLAERTPLSAGELIDRSRPLEFWFEGRKVYALEGDTIASALYSAKVRIFSRSFKYHRARGLFCVSGRCPNCLVNVDGRPNVRACVEPAKSGIRVKRQNAWPSPNHDLFSLVEKLGRFLPVGFYYKTFINFPWEWKRVQGVIRRIAGVGSLDDELRSWSGGRAGPDFGHQFIRADVAVVGGGPAGIVAAREAARLGASVVLIDDQTSLGGHLRYSGEVVNLESEVGEGNLSGLKGYEAAAEVAKGLSTRQTVTVLSNSTAFGFFEANLLGVLQGRKMIKVRAREVIVATGARERQSVFENNDLPGVFQGEAVQRLVRLYGVSPGRAAVVVGDSTQGLTVVRTLVEAGVQVVAYADERPDAKLQPGELQFLKDAGTQLLAGYTVKEALGRKGITGVVLARKEDAGQLPEGSERRFGCDFICVATSPEADTSLLCQAGCKTIYDTGLRQFVVSEQRENIRQCGDVTGIHNLNVTILQGKVVGLTSALSLLGNERAWGETKVQHVRNDLDSFSKLLGEAMKHYTQEESSLSSVGGSTSPSRRSRKATEKRFVCICEDVLDKDLYQAIDEGFDDIETLKRYSTLAMGPCQGKLCLTPSIAICASQTGRTIGETGRTVSRSPFQPVPMGAISGPELHRVKLTAMHYKHLQLGAKMMDMGEWKRPLVYTSVADEYKAVRERVGIIDVGTLGRLDVKGADTPRLLDFVYTHNFSRLQLGKTRYGVLCDEAGTILDDGTVTRLSENHYFITTTTGNIDFVEQWLGWWAAALRLDAHVTNLTAGMAAVNVAGPRARELLEKLTSINLSSVAFPYMNSAEGVVAGVPCILLRIGFVGETGWEIHFPAEYGQYFWDALIQAGGEFGLKPFGVEAQRVLRLEKKHLIVGQDTDALSNPYEADMAWAVKLEKEDFVGKAALQAIQRKGPGRKLVGLVMQWQGAHDGDQVYSPSGSTLIGFVTSARFSPSTGTTVGMALVPSEIACEGQGVRVMTMGALKDARVTLAPFYDPEGKRLRT